ncbi:hypothetical protein QCA50_002412 [Cerrena zonata]|uniref:Uncharacterized protein n=1 Tax=Cerrena zonata TaxID=2478898 RepID=A0AAW0GTE1_9APHY
MVMQGGSVFDDIADRVLKVDPNDVDARYVQFFHEKIPSRQLAESTTTHQLDRLIAVQPHRLEFFRTRGIVHCFRDEYACAVKDFTHALRESRAQRKARAAHRSSVASDHHHGKGSRKKTGKGVSKTNGQAPPNGTSAPSISKSPSIDGPNGEPLLLHPSVLPDAPDPIEPQCVFLRGAAYLQHAVYLIEDAIFRLEGVRKQPSAEGGEIRLCYIENGRYGGLEVANPDGPLGSRDGAKLQAYRNTLANSGFRDQVTGLIKKALRDHEKFLSYFDTLEGHHSDYTRRNLAEKAELAFRICENMRPTSHHAPPPLPDLPVMFTTYHPLLVESHFSVLICQLLLGDFISLVPNFYRAAQLVDGLEGYPVFLPPRSMAQAEFVEVLERLASGWKNGIQPHTLSLSNELALVPTSRSNGKGVDHSMLSPIIASATSSSSDLTIDTTISGSSSSTPTYLRMAASGSSCPYDDISGVIDDSSPSIVEHSPTGGEVILSNAVSNILVDSLDYARMLLVPVAARQREKRIERSAVEKASINGKRKPMNINIPLHGPRVEVLLAWVGAVHLYELDSVA